MTRSILVPVDGSIPANKALFFAITMAKAFGDEIVLLNVQPDFRTRNTKRFFSNEQIQDYTYQLSEEATEEAIELLQESGVPFKTLVKIGVPKFEICLEAKETKARCIVMGSRGMGPVTGKILGSVSYGVLHESTCPVIIVP